MAKINKRGVIGEYIVWIIITLVSAGILFLLFPSIQKMFVGGIDRETCHSSVLIRSTAIGGKLLGEIGQIPLKEFPLKCKTEQINITSSDPEAAKKRVADAMYDCWWMLGEGKEDFFDVSTFKAVSGFKTTESACIICSVISFKGEAEKIGDIDILPYLQNNVPGTNYSYSTYFSGEKDTILPSEVRTQQLSSDKKYAVVFSTIKGGDFAERLKTDLKLVTAGALGSIVVTGPKFAIGTLFKYAGKALANPYVAATAAIAILAQMGFEGWNQHVAVMYCDGSKQGCNMMSIIEYKVEDIVKKCQNIESIP